MRTVRMRMLAVLLAAVAGATTAAAPAQAAPKFTMTVLASGLANPWEIVRGPDAHLWTTEKFTGRITRVSLADGTKKTAVTIPDVVATRGGPQDGLLGMALHPDLLRGASTNPYVYVSYTYDADPATDTLLRRQKIVRYTYDKATELLSSPLELISGMPVTIDHLSGRLVIGPDKKIYYSIGDGGKNQYTLYCEPIMAQALPTAAQVAARNWNTYQGKILRLNLDGTIPLDNPVINGVRSHVYTYGHRNAQGLTFGPTGLLYASEQGPKSDDELNLIVPGGNYGWPHVVGRRDNLEYTYANWSAAPNCASLEYSDFTIPASVPQRTETSFFDLRYVEPMRSLFPATPGQNFQDPKCVVDGIAIYPICWPTIAASSAEVYTSTAVPGWWNSVLIPSLKYGTIYRVPLGLTGLIAGEPELLFKTVNRYRDTAISTDGRTIYVATDGTSIATDLNGLPTADLANPGSILAFTLA
ncbi:PQQ-dependent dehydrogenase (s-GDH family) [Actinoplanes lutulentus]|uniref:PQQ-dependent dehydrogenase (S-GDH family) n=1 Tax=Actinoplanes lutulentus TaxID=1287878 RepID=A0A327YVK6_9ACTN|nr:glucose/sorbosone family PQQ-dependent dehydrogenase [Actinoplanes lutulentus]MBB2940546.1 PQQ-dependent dehydrogenase (s-GDH family) [Actinoplanes lutulentus]RAK24816.1 PQQ-dependent dehydrogenase (s-GDH family) [Actinoplanes lutulentus]